MFLTAPNTAQRPRRKVLPIYAGLLILGWLGVTPAQAQEAFYVVERGQEASCEITPQPRADDTVIGDPDGYPNFDEAQAALEELCDDE